MVLWTRNWEQDQLESSQAVESPCSQAVFTGSLMKPHIQEGTCTWLGTDAGFCDESNWVTVFRSTKASKDFSQHGKQMLRRYICQVNAQIKARATGPLLT